MRGPAELEEHIYLGVGGERRRLGKSCVVEKQNCSEELDWFRDRTVGDAMKTLSLEGG